MWIAQLKRLIQRCANYRIYAASNPKLLRLKASLKKTYLFKVGLSIISVLKIPPDGYCGTYGNSLKSFEKTFEMRKKWSRLKKSYSAKVNYLNDYTLTRLNKLQTSSTIIPTYLKINRFYDLD